MAVLMQDVVILFVVLVWLPLVLKLSFLLTVTGVDANDVSVFFSSASTRHHTVLMRFNAYIFFFCATLLLIHLLTMYFLKRFLLIPQCLLVFCLSFTAFFIISFVCYAFPCRSALRRHALKLAGGRTVGRSKEWG